MKGVMGKSGSVSDAPPPYLLVGLVVLLAMILRLHNLAFESLFMDEILQVSFYHHTIAQIIGDAAIQSQMPLDYWIGHFVSQVLDSDFSVRLPAALFGTAAVLMMTLIVGQALSWQVGILSGLLLTLSPFHLYYSQEARPYALPIFFFLFLINSLRRVLYEDGIRFKEFLLLFIASTGYLYSRTDAPLISTFALTLILAGWFCLSSWQPRWGANRVRVRLLLSVCVFGLSFLVAAPTLWIVLSAGARYADNPTTVGLETIYSGIEHFSVRPLWRAFLAQTEPLGYVYLAGLLLLPILLLKFWGSREMRFLLVVAILLPAASLTHVLIFKAKVSLPMRPPYFVYLLPLVLILWSAFVHLLLQRFRSHGAQKLFLGVATLLVLWSATAVWTTKGVRKKANWRDMVAHVDAQLPEPNVLVFDTISRHPRYSPDFFGFPRYHRGDWNERSRSCVRMQDTVPLAPALARANQPPCVILFYYRNYFATPNSSIPVHGTPSQYPVTDTTDLHDHPELAVTSFTCFEIVQLRRSTGNTAKDLLRIVDILIAALPDDSGALNLHLAAASLRRALDAPGWEGHITHIESKFLSDLSAETTNDLLVRLEAIRADQNQIPHKL